MSELKTQFEQATKDVKTLSSKPDNKTLLQLYALFKQATEGDVRGDEPWFSDFVGRAKWDAWTKLEGTPSEESMQKYIELVRELLNQ
ncbi:acyl-CoA-binding protein [bacterium]|nr:acyl-CoA-binding protein [bacterium]MBL7052563.1 acyl-CoA-binding protein [Candidatus Neomarinimicrobiota bacterium]